MRAPIYLDHNATTPVDPRVLTSLLPYLSTHFGNPSSGHQIGRVAHDAVEKARGEVADLIGATPSAITFAGSGSEANWLAILGAAAACGDSHRREIVMLATEHPSVLAAVRAARDRFGMDVVTVPVGMDGRASMPDLRFAVSDSTFLVSAQLANGETGTVQPVAEIAAVARSRGALLQVDAAQAAGKIPIDVEALGADLLTVVGHKMYAPKGVAALYHRPGVELLPLIDGGGQESGLRSGTENVPYIVGLGAACRIASDEMVVDAARTAGARSLLHRLLRERLGDRVQLNGHPTERLPNTLNVSIDGTRGSEVLESTSDVAASTGSACHSGSSQPSPVLMSMGLGADRALAALRLTLGRWTTESEIVYAAEALATAVEKLT